MVYTTSRNKALLLSAVAFSAILLYLLTHMLWPQASYIMADILLCSAVALLAASGTSRLRMPRYMKALVLFAFAARLTLAVVECYGTGPLSAFLTTDDGFYAASLKRWMGDTTAYKTNYTHILLAIYGIAGTDRIVPAVINVLLWFLGYYLIEAAAGGFYEKYGKYYLLLYTFLPYPLLLSVMVVRESVIWISLMLSFFSLLKWMERGKLRQIAFAILFAAPAIWMHRGNVAMWLTIFAVYVFWQPKRQEWSMLNWKAWLLPLGLLLTAFLYLHYFGATDSLQGALKAITTLHFKLAGSARANYIPSWDMTYRNPLQFLGNTLYLMFYFWLSPTPRFWNAPIDLAGAFLDTTPWLLFYFFYFKELRRKDTDKRAFAGVIIVLAFTFAYGWGTRNAGTAMRHRDQLLGVMVMAAMVAANRPQPFAKKSAVPEAPLAQLSARAQCAEE